MVSQFPRSNFFRKVADWRRAGRPLHRCPRALPGSNQARSPITSLARQMLACLCFIAAGIFTTSGLATHAGAAAVGATLDRDSVPAGNGALLTLTITGSRVDQIQLPEVENLIIQGRDQSRQIQMNGGQTIVSLTCTYAVGSNTPGNYQIPPIAVSIDGQQLTTKPLTLKVLDAAAAQAPTPSGAPPTAGQAPDTSGKRFGFLTVELLIKDRNYLYVGEIAPVSIRTWLPEDARAPGTRQAQRPTRRPTQRLERGRSADTAGCQAGLCLVVSSGRPVMRVRPNACLAAPPPERSSAPSTCRDGNSHPRGPSSSCPLRRAAGCGRIFRGRAPCHPIALGSAVEPTGSRHHPGGNFRPHPRRIPRRPILPRGRPLRLWPPRRRGSVAPLALPAGRSIGIPNAFRPLR